MGAQAWMKKLSWPQQKIYQTAPMTQWRDKTNHVLLGYDKQGGGFEWVTVLNAGHMVPIDQPRANQLVEAFVTEHTTINSKN